MSNWCNNYANITSRLPLKWLDERTSTDAVELPGSEIYAFWLEVNHKVLGTWSHDYELLFQTKWAPPIDFYDHLAKDSSILIYADYSESGNQLLWTYDINGHHEAEWPNTFYSEILDQEIHLVDPCQTYIDIEKDEYLLFVDYLKWMYDAIIPNTNELAIENEIQECAEQLNVNLEDQQWVECVANNMPDEMLNHVPAPIIS